MQFLILGWTIPFKVQAYLHFVVAILNSATVPYQTHLRVWWIAEQPMDTTPTLFKPNVLREHKSKMFAQLQPVETSKLVLSAASAKTTLSVSHWVYTVRWDLLRHLPPSVCVWIRGVNYFQSLGPQRVFFFFWKDQGRRVGIPQHEKMLTDLKLFGAICVSTLSKQKGDTEARTTFLIIAQRSVGSGQGCGSDAAQRSITRTHKQMPRTVHMSTLEQVARIKRNLIFKYTKAQTC